MRYSDLSPLSVVLMSPVPSTKVHAWGGECREQLCSAIVRISDRLQFLILRGETVSLCSQVGVNHNGGHLLVEACDLFVVSKFKRLQEKNTVFFHGFILNKNNSISKLMVNGKWIYNQFKHQLIYKNLQPTPDPPKAHRIHPKSPQDYPPLRRTPRCTPVRNSKLPPTTTNFIKPLICVFTPT